MRSSDPKGRRIADVRAREILDSRGNPTVAVRVTLRDGFVGDASVPSGASTGTHEALELRDGDAKRYGGKGVLKAVRNVNARIRTALLGMDVTAQRRIDDTMIALDGTPNKSKLGANAILGASLACARAAAASSGLPLYRYLRKAYRIPGASFPMPLPMMNVLNGGAHADFAIDFQECIIIPKMRTMHERVRAGSEVFHALGKLIKKAGHVTSVGDEGGYAPRLGGNEKAFKLIVEAIRAAGYRPGKDIAVGMDAASSEFYDAKRKRYTLKADRKVLTAAQLDALYASWFRKYPFLTLEDGMAEDDWENWEKHTKRHGKRITLVGDDLFVTDVKRLKQGIARGVANAILIKVNQIGSLSETMDAILLAKKNGYKVAVSHRSGETADAFIADLAVATASEFIKTGSLSRSERLEKYNRLMEIEDETTGKK
jgi:enolase